MLSISYIHASPYGGREDTSPLNIPPITNRNLILKLFQAASLPKRAAVIHCKGYQQKRYHISIGNNKADTEAKRQDQNTQPLTQLLVTPSKVPPYTNKEHLNLPKPGMIFSNG